MISRAQGLIAHMSCQKSLYQFIIRLAEQTHQLWLMKTGLYKVDQKKIVTINLPNWVAYPNDLTTYEAS